MNNNLAEVILIVDKSGSMQSLRDSTISGINELINDQKNQIKDVKLTVVQFNDKYHLHTNCVDVKNVNEFTKEDYSPDGMTALYDAVGKTIDNVGLRLANTPEEDRPSTILVAIITDGFENASQEYTSDVIKEKIELQTNQYNWNFMFIGANQDAILSARTIGIGASNAMGFAPVASGSAHVYSTITRASTVLYSTGKLEISDEDREYQTNLGAVKSAVGQN